MLGIAFKGTARVDVSVPLAAFVASKYPSTEADKHQDAITAFAALREAAASAHSEGAADTLRRYYVQCGSAATKFPLSEAGGALGARLTFSWSDSMRPGIVVQQASWAYERACVLFNLAALASQSAGGDRTTAAGKEAAKAAYCRTAGVLSFIATSLSPRLGADVPLDLSQQGLLFLQHLMLAQAQAVYYELARDRGMKPETLAKLAAQAADWYREAARALVASGEAGVTAEKGWPWRAHCEFWAALWDAASFRQQATRVLAAAEESGSGYGEEIAWLQAAEAAAKEAIAVPARIAAAIKGAITGSVDTSRALELLGDVQPRLAAAQKDNSSIYFQPVPKLAALPAVPRAALAKPIPFEDITFANFAATAWPSAAAERAGAGAAAGGGAGAPSAGASPPPVDLFANILPPEVAASASHMDDLLAAVANDAKARASKANEELKGVLAELGLPAALEGAGDATAPGVPAALWSRVRQVQLEGGLEGLEGGVSANSVVAAAARDVFRGVEAVLEEEAAADRRHRETWGPRWPLPASELLTADIRGELAKYASLVGQASSSDAAVAERLAAARPALARLSLPKAELDASVPAGFAPGTAASTAGAASAEAVRAELAALVARCSTVHEERLRLSAGVKPGFDRPAAVAALAAAPSTDHAAITERLLAAPWPALRAFEDSLAAQGALVEALRRMSARFSEVRSADARTRAREAAIQALGTAVDGYEALRGNVKEGAEFWRELKGCADALLGKAKDFAQARALSARDNALHLQVGAAPPAAAAPGATGPAYPLHSFAGARPGAGGGVGAVAVALSPGAPSGNPFDEFPPASGGARTAAAAPAAPAQPAPGAGGWAGAGYGAGGYGAAPYGVPPGVAASRPAAAPAPFARPAAPAAAAPAVPAASAASQLLGMGFPRDRVDRALAMHGGAFEAALNQLLTE